MFSTRNTGLSHRKAPSGPFVQLCSCLLCSVFQVREKFCPSKLPLGGPTVAGLRVLRSGSRPSVLSWQGLIKIRGDQCWRDLTCMDFHYEVSPTRGTCPPRHRCGLLLGSPAAPSCFFSREGWGVMGRSRGGLQCPSTWGGLRPGGRGSRCPWLQARRSLGHWSLHRCPRSCPGTLSGQVGWPRAPPGWEVLHCAPCPPAMAEGRGGRPQSHCAHVSKAPTPRSPPLPGTPPRSKPFWTFVSLLTAHVCGGRGPHRPVNELAREHSVCVHREGLPGATSLLVTLLACTCRDVSFRVSRSRLAAPVRERQRALPFLRGACLQPSAPWGFSVLTC